MYVFNSLFSLKAFDFEAFCVTYDSLMLTNNITQNRQKRKTTIFEIQ